MTSTIDIYNGRNPTEIPAYSIGEASRYLRLAPSTLRSWVLGRTYPGRTGTLQWDAIIEIADRERRVLSFRNLVEVHVLKAVRQKHRIKIDAVRESVEYLRKSLCSKHPLADQSMLTNGKDLFVEHYGQYVSVSSQGQTAMKEVLELYLTRIDRDISGIPIRLYPFMNEEPARRTEPSAVVIDPTVQFGRPCLKRTGIPTAVIAGRLRAGDSPKVIAKDYGLPTDDIEEARQFEAA